MKVERFIFGPFQTNTYVVSDDRYILLVDPACYTPYEQQQLYRYIENLSPFNFHLSILATHGHLDHLWGAAWACEKWNTPVLMHEADIPMAKAMQSQYDLFGIPAKAQPFPIEDIKSKIKNQKSQISNFQLLETPGHTPGEIVLLDRKDRILFAGDGLVQHLWLQLEESLPVAKQIESMERLLPLRDQFDIILHGHCQAPCGAELFDTMLAALKDLAAGNTADDIDYEWYGRISKAHPFQPEDRRIVYKDQSLD